jgi:ADP-ribose pyrophosphatase
MEKPRHWETLHRETVFTGGPIREVAIESVRLPNGRTVSDFYQIVLPDYVLVYAEMQDGTVPMLRQYKHGLRRVCLSFPGGAIEDGESPIDAARRELLEETGCTAERWVGYGSFVTNANQYCNSAHLFRAEGCARVSAPLSPDIEMPELVALRVEDLLKPEVLEEIGLASHVALLSIATHPHYTPPITR